VNAPRLSVFICLLVLIACCASVQAGTEKPAEHSRKPLVLAFYHPWYGTPWGPTGKWKQWSSFKFPERYQPEKVVAGRHQIASGDYPLIGPYDTSDPEVVRWHFRLAKAAGIDGFLCSWWKTGKEDGYWAHQAELFGKVWLPVAEQENFKIGIIDECAHYVPKYGQLISRITNSLPGYARSPAYLRINGQPVWFVYQVWDDWITPAIANKYVTEAEEQVGDVYWIFDKLKATAIARAPGAVLSVGAEWLAIPKIDCYGTYSLFGHWRESRQQELIQLYAGFTQNVRQSGKEVQLVILPGHNNAAVNEKPYVVPRERGKVLERFCKAIDKARPEVAIVCSFNEWFEMTEIEPSANWDDPYLYLKVLAKWRGKEWRVPPLPPGTSMEPGVDSHPGR
jgi:hypothetical protein